ncbi:MAG: hypothetical protein IPO67_24145 [Deltaproteobacteria bacterium]|nr:hypothetical protein [Deltaproteobacteria bacterium]
MDVIFDATQHYALPLTPERLFSWHHLLFPTGLDDLGSLTVGAWRTGPMQVISGHLDRIKVHFVAPEAPRLDEEGARFLRWFNAEDSLDGIIRRRRAPLVHHDSPSTTATGRLARAIEGCPWPVEERPWRCYSLSTQIPGRAPTTTRPRVRPARRAQHHPGCCGSRAPDRLPQRRGPAG